MKAVKNKKAYHDYEIIETLEVGIVLTGNEVKSIKGGTISLAGSYVQIRNGQLWLLNTAVSTYQYGSGDQEVHRTRQLLAHKKEIERLSGKIKQKRLTLIPLKVYTVRGKVKLLVGLCQGRNRREKKRKEKEKDLMRELHCAKREHMV